MPTFAKRLTTAMFRAGLTQTELAKRLNITKGALNQWTSGATTPHPANMVRVAQLLGVDPVWLRTGEKPSNHAPLQHVPVPNSLTELWAMLLPEQQQEVLVVIESMVARNKQTLAELLKKYGTPVSDEHVAQFLPLPPKT